MTMEEVEQCDFAYILYEKEDPEVHCFLRMHSTSMDVWFDRPLVSRQMIGSVHCQPHLLKELYSKQWWAFTAKPDYQQIVIKKRMMKE